MVARFINRARRALSQPLTLILFSVLMTFAFMTVALIPLTRFDARERLPELNPFVPSSSSQFGEGTQLVKTQFFADAFPTFDVTANNFVVTGYLWFEFDPNIIPLKSLAQFSVEGGTINDRIEVENVIVGNLLRVKYKIKATFSTNLDHHRFPLADHRIYFILTNDVLSSRELILQSLPSDFAVSQRIEPEGWKLEGTSVAYGEVQSAPRVIYTFEFKKPGFREALTIIIPLFLIYLLGIVALMIRSAKDSSTALSLSVGGISGILAYRFVVEAISPKVGYLLLSDELTLLFFVATFTVFLRCAYDHAITTRARDSEGAAAELDTVNIFLFYAIQIGVLVTTYLLVFR